MTQSIKDHVNKDNLNVKNKNNEKLSKPDDFDDSDDGWDDKMSQNDDSDNNWPTLANENEILINSIVKQDKPSISAKDRAWKCPCGHTNS